MALEITAPTVSDAPIERRAGRAVDHGPNLVLDNGWLKQSYDTGKTFEVPVDGKWEEDTIKKGDKKGEKVMRMTGDAAEVVRQLREAAQTLGIGVTIKDYPVVNKRTKNPVEGKLLIKYQGIKRKATRKARSNGGETAPVTGGATPETAAVEQ